ncbi:MAG: prepilin peptidase [Pirellulales bacterium]|nr:prepilin peptidase [Pirellulales bacterium]
MFVERILTAFQQHAPVWLVAITLVVAAVIDGYKLKVPNWLTFPMILSGWALGAYAHGWEGLGLSLLGTAVGLALLLPAYAIGGMGAGDVKLLAGVGSWLAAAYLMEGVVTTFYAFFVSALVGGVLALTMVLFRRSWRKHKDQFLTIVNEMVTIGNPTELATIAAKRKSSMLLLPYGIPIAIGSIAYFIWAGMLI